MLTLTVARPSDAGEILSLYAPFVRESTITFEYEVPSLAEFQRRVEGTLPQYPWLLCREGERLLGYAYAGPHHPRAAYAWDAALSIYLAPEAQGKGMGLPLGEALMELLYLQNYYVVYSLVTEGNAMSEAWHKKAGFRDVGRWADSGYKHGKWLDVLCLERVLRPREGAPAPVIPMGELDPAVVSEVLTRWQTALNEGRTAP